MFPVAAGSREGSRYSLQNSRPARPQAQGIGNRGDQGGNREKERRIVPAVKRHLAAVKDRLLGGMLQRRLSRRPPAGPAKSANPRHRCWKNPFRAVCRCGRSGRRRPRSSRQRPRPRDAKHDQAVAAHPRSRQPVPPASQGLARNDLFCRGILGILRTTLTGGLLTFPKAWAESAQVPCDAACCV